MKPGGSTQNGIEPAKGKRATLLKSQIMALEQKLSALNLELEKKKAQTPEVKLPDI